MIMPTPMTDRDTLAAVEVLAVLRGRKSSDRATLKLALKELVARGALELMIGEVPRGRGDPKWTTVATPGPTLGPTDNPVLNAVLAIVHETRPIGVVSAQLIDDFIAGSAQPLDPDGRTSTCLGDVDGVPVFDLVGELLRRYRPSGWSSMFGWDRQTHGVVTGLVLPSLVAMGLFAPGHVRTVWGEQVRSQYAVRLGGGREASLERALTADLRSWARDAGAWEAAFRLIDSAVETEWEDWYGGSMP